MARRQKGEGSIWFSKSENTWICEITLPDGRRKKKRNKVKQVVVDWRFEQRQNIHLNLPLKDDKITLGHYLDRFMDDVAEHTLKPSTIRSYRYLIEDHINLPLAEPSSLNCVLSRYNTFIR